MNGIEIRIKGKVQGVGFRPFVWQLANELKLKGEVLNDGQGVLIRLQSTPVTSSTTELFQSRLELELPPLASIESQSASSFVWDTEPDSFSIVKSESTAMDTQVVPDAATCPDCLKELYNNGDPRFQYPFINCTHCGPRFTIIKELPYDRPKTVMSEFPLCPRCNSEYKDPADRRYHAQPVACPDCGPKVWLVDNEGNQLNGNWLEVCSQALTDGKVIAIRSVGGFHLACDATNQNAVQKLRDRKHREFKPFAVMLPTLESINDISHCTPLEAKTLQSSASPIVLLKKKSDSSLADNIAPQLNEVGVMLPSNPVQHLIATSFVKPVVMTSGNGTGLPPALTNQEAVDSLSGIADLFILHNREIVQRCDDSLVRIDSEGNQETLRRSRGFVPDAVNLPEGFPDADSFIAYGGDLKNAFAIGKGQQIVVSQYLGDLSNIETQTQYQDSISHYEALYQIENSHHVADKHSGYFSHQFAKSRTQTPILIQHHHAHIASCLIENVWKPAQGKVLGLVLDGLGMGDDGTLWGAELMIADYANYQKIGGLPAIQLVGGDKAAKQPWRSLYAHTSQFSSDNEHYAPLFSDKPLELLERARTSGINTHRVRSAGRLFDAVAASLDIAFDKIEYEGQAACQLEALAHQCDPLALTSELKIETNGLDLDLSSFWDRWSVLSIPKEEKAYLFHSALAEAFARITLRAAKLYSISTVVLSGGVFHNALLRRLLNQHLQGSLKILEHHLFSCGDGSLALGQLAIALYKTNQSQLGNLEEKGNTK